MQPRSEMILPMARYMITMVVIVIMAYLIATPTISTSTSYQPKERSFVQSFISDQRAHIYVMDRWYIQTDINRADGGNSGNASNGTRRVPLATVCFNGNGT